LLPSSVEQENLRASQRLISRTVHNYRVITHGASAVRPAMCTA
jgi:hypothetical protein